MTRLPTTKDEALLFATALREFVLGDDAAVDGDCIAATSTACLVSDDIETYCGTINGAGHHVIVVGEYLIDVTGDQFGLAPITVIHRDDLDGSGYGGFTPSQFRRNYQVSQRDMGNFWALVAEFDGSEKLIEA